MKKDFGSDLETNETEKNAGNPTSRRAFLKWSSATALTAFASSQIRIILFSNSACILM